MSRVESKIGVTPAKLCALIVLIMTASLFNNAFGGLPPAVAEGKSNLLSSFD